MDDRLLLKLSPFFLENKPLYFKKDQVIVRPEDSISHIYFIEKGYVRFYNMSDEGKELTFLIYKPGYIFPVIYTFLGSRTRYYFEAITPVVVRRANRDDFIKLLSKSPELSILIYQEILKRFDETLNKMELISYGGADKIVAFILQTYSEQLGQKEGKGIVINLPLTHKDIGSLAGLSRETVSIEMKKLENKKLISYKRSQIKIENADSFKKKTGLD